MRTAIVTLLAVSIGAGSLQAQEPALSLLLAARAEAARQATSATTTPRTQMRPGLKWAGIGLLGGGGVLLLVGTRDASECPVDPTGYDADCVNPGAWVPTVMGGLAAISGGVLLLIGTATKRPAPSVEFGGNRVTLRIRF